MLYLLACKGFPARHSSPLRSATLLLDTAIMTVLLIG